MIPGITLTDGVTTLVVAPVNLRIQFDEATKDDFECVAKGSGSDAAAYTQSAISLLLACARRNHPTATREQLLELVDFADLGPLLGAVLTKSGFTPRPLGEARAIPAPGPE
jgi:hypothetical protein